jgi:transposase
MNFLRAFIFSNHLKSTKIKQSSFGKHQRHTKIKHPHFDRKLPKYPDAKGQLQLKQGENFVNITWFGEP